MKKVRAAHVLLCALTLVALLPARAQSDPAAEAAIRHVLDRQTADWNRGDIEAFMQGYENSPQTTFVGQIVQYGYATILERYKKTYTTPAARGKLAFTHLAVRALDPSYAAVTGNFHLERSQAGGGDANGIFSLLLKKLPQGWKIILDHTSKTS